MPSQPRRLYQGDAEKGNGRLVPWKDTTGLFINQTNIGTVSKATLGKLLRDGVEHIMGFPQCCTELNCWVWTSGLVHLSSEVVFVVCPVTLPVTVSESATWLSSLAVLKQKYPMLTNGLQWATTEWAHSMPHPLCHQRADCHESWRFTPRVEHCGSVSGVASYNFQMKCQTMLLITFF